MKIKYLCLALLLASQPGLGHETRPTHPESANNEKHEQPLVSFPGLPGTSMEVNHANIPLTIRYSPDMDPQSLTVSMNGDNITDRFHPGARQEVVQIQLVPGTNSVEVKAKPLGTADDEKSYTLTLVRRNSPAVRLHSTMQRGKFDKNGSKESAEKIIRALSSRDK